MKHSLFTILIASSGLLFANPLNTNTAPTINEHIKNAVIRVESARENTIAALKSMVSTVDNARDNAKKSAIDSNTSIHTQIMETHAISQIAKGTASVEIAKAKAMSLITKAIDRLDPNSLEVVANAVADVEVTKAKAKALIVKATKRVELSKTKEHKAIKHPQETLTIAKNVSAIQIAKSVAQTEVARAISLIEIAKSSVKSALPDSMKNISIENSEKLDKIKAEATAKISSYLAQIEIMKANMLAKIAEEVAKVEMAKLNAVATDANTTEIKSSN